MNYDGSRGENFSKLKIKNNAKLNNKDKDILNFDISRRISEGDIVGRISTIYYQNNGWWVSKYFNETYGMMNDNKLQHNISPVVKLHTKLSRPRFCLNVILELSSIHEIPEVAHFHVDWGWISITPLFDCPREILKNIAYHLFLGSLHIGGRLSSTSIVDGYTEIEKYGHILRTHPCYSNKWCWYD